jgi:hypothetical protein
MNNNKYDFIITIVLNNGNVIEKPFHLTPADVISEVYGFLDNGVTFFNEGSLIVYSAASIFSVKAELDESKQIIFDPIKKNLFKDVL